MSPAAVLTLGSRARRSPSVALEVALRELPSRSVPVAAGPPEAVRMAGVTLVPARGGRVTLRPRGAATAVAAAPEPVATRGART